MATGAALGTGASIKWAADQEQAFMRVNKIMNLNDDAQKRMKESYRELANQYGQSTVDIANSGADLAATGLFESEEALIKGTESLIKVNAAWGGQMETTSKYLSQVATGYKLDAEGMERWGSAVAVLADETGASEEQIARGAEAFVGLRHDMGLSIDQVNGFTAAFAEIGTQPEEAKTQLKSMFDTFTSGSKQSIAAMKKLGITTQMYDNAVRQGKLPDLFALVGERLKGVTSEMERANMAGDLFGSYGRSMAATLPNVIEAYREYAETSRKSYEENTRATEEANKALNTFYGQLNRTKNILMNFGAEIGDTMLKPLTDGLYTLNDVLVKAFAGDIPGALQTLRTALANFDFSSILNGITSQMSNISGVLLATFIDAANRISQIDWSSLFGNAVSAISGAAASMGNALMNAPWGSWAASAAGAFSAGMSALASLGGNLVNWVTSAFNGIDMGAVRQAGVNAANSFIAGATSISIGDAIIGSIILVGSAGSVLIEFGAGVARGIYDAAKGWLSGKWDSVVSFGTGAIESAKAWGTAIAGAVDAGFRLAINGVISAAETAINGLGSGINGIAKMVPGLDKYVSVGTISLPRVDASNAQTQLNDFYKQVDSAKNWDPVKSWNPGNIFGGNSGLATVTGKSNQEMGITDEGAKKITDAMAKDLKTGEQPYNFFKTAAKEGMSLGDAFSYYETNKGNVNAAYGFSPDVARKNYLMGLSGNMYGGNGLEGYTGGTPKTKSLLDPTYGTEAKPLVTKDVGVQTMISAPTTAIPSFYNWNPSAAPVAAAAPSAEQLAKQAYNAKNDDPFGILPNLKQFSSELVKASAEGAGFCEAISELGYMQEHTEGLFQESYIGPTSGRPGGIDAAQTATQVKGVTIGAATTAKGITIGAAKDASSVTLGNAYQISSVQTQTQTTLNAQARLANDNKLAAEAATCGMWDEANSRWTANSERMEQIRAENTTKTNVAAQDFKEKMGATSGKWEQSSLNVTNGLTKWSESHIASMNKFDENLTAHLNGTFAGLTAGMSGGQPVLLSETMGGGPGGAGGAAMANPYAIAYNQTAKAVSGTLLQLQAVQKGVSDLGGVQARTAYGGSWYVGGAGIANGTGWGAQASAAAQAGTASGIAGHSVRWFADGGIISKPSIVGVGEAGTEAIVPIDKLPGMIQNIMGGAPSGGAHTHAIYMDGKKVADAVGAAMVSRTRQSAGLKVR
jgi:TP901 family phage tail tape measure protein